MAGGTDAVTDFDCEPFESRGIEHLVYCTGRGPVVIVMHEVAGLSPVELELGRRIADAGYKVLMPLFFGSVGQDSALKGAIQICVAREFTLLRTNHSSKITKWLRALAQKFDDGRGVAAIGMCATGGLVLGMLLEDAVVAGVSSQPSLPFVFRWSGTKKKTNLGLDKHELDELKRRQKPLLSLRFKHDRLCPGLRLEGMQRDLGAEKIEVPEGGNYAAVFPPLRTKAHSVLTYDHVELPDHPTERAFEDVVKFLRRHLPPESSETASRGAPGGP